MGRPSLSLGCHGSFRTYPEGSQFRSRCKVRDYDGVIREVQRVGRSKAAAEKALSEALRDRARIDAAAEITPDTRLAAVAEVWFVDFGRQDRSPTTVAAYRDRLDKQILPALGSVRIREVTVGLVDRHLRAVEAKHGAAMAKQTKTVLSQMIGLAVRHDALAQNPVRDTSSISNKPKNPPRALTAPQAAQLMALITYDDQAVRRDLPVLVATMLATGLRLGEACGLLWRSVDFPAATIEVEATVVRIKSKGLLRKSTKTTAGHRTLRLPKWGVEMLQERAAAITATGGTPVFPSPLGNMRDASNTAADLREAFANAGFEWATSHVLRKTNASILDAAGLSPREIADQLGHARPSMTMDRYMGRKIASERGATALEALA
jgi:integrase